MPDVFLYSVPSDADPDDVRLRDPAGSVIETKEGSAPLSAAAAITVAGLKLAASAAPVSAVAQIAALGEVVAQVSERDPGAGKRREDWPNEYAPVRQRTQQEQVDAVVALMRPEPPPRAPEAQTYDDDEEELILWLIAA